MKIENDKPGALGPLGSLTDAADLLNRIGDRTAETGKAAAGTSTSDELTLSSDVRTLQAAAAEAAEPQPIRQDVVERMRRLLADGTVGDDASKLADAIIEDWLKLNSR